MIEVDGLMATVVAMPSASSPSSGGSAEFAAALALVEDGSARSESGSGPDTGVAGIESGAPSSVDPGSEEGIAPSASILEILFGTIAPEVADAPVALDAAAVDGAVDDDGADLDADPDVDEAAPVALTSMGTGPVPVPVPALGPIGAVPDLAPIVAVPDLAPILPMPDVVSLGVEDAPAPEQGSSGVVDPSVVGAGGPRPDVDHAVMPGVQTEATVRALPEESTGVDVPVTSLRGDGDDAIPAAPGVGQQVVEPAMVIGEGSVASSSVASSKGSTEALTENAATAATAVTAPTAATASTAEILDPQADASVGATTTHLPDESTASAGPAPADRQLPMADGPVTIDLPVTGAPTPARAETNVAVMSDVAPAPGTPTSEATPTQQVAEALRELRRLADGSHRLSLQLHPEELGAVQLEIALRDGRLHVRAVAETEAARMSLEQNLPQLRSELRDAGVRAGSLEVGPDASGRDRSNSSNPEARPTTDPWPSRAGIETPRAPSTPQPSSGLDIRL